MIIKLTDTQQIEFDGRQYIPLTLIKGEWKSSYRYFMSLPSAMHWSIINGMNDQESIEIKDYIDRYEAITNKIMGDKNERYQ